MTPALRIRQSGLYAHHLNERKLHEDGPPLSKQIALAKELQTESYTPNPPGEIELCFSTGALRLKTSNENLSFVRS